jgi:hypothetical protein
VKEESNHEKMQGGHGYYGGRDDPPPQGYGYNTAGYGYDAGAYGSTGGYYSTGGGYPAAYADPLVGAEQRGHEYPAPLNGLEFQPSETCPKNYVIFDQTCTKSRVMFHPSLAHKLGAGNSSGCDDQHHHHQYYDYYGGGAQHGMGAYRDKDEDDDSCSSGVRQKEDTAEIDALLSSDQDEDDVVSTGRTPSGYGGGDGSSPDSTCSSSYGGKPKRPKKERIKKMVRTLKGIIPGGSQMVDTPAVLDEAVRYLKSLKVEAKKLGVRGGSDS